MKKAKRVLALLGVILLIGLYIMTLVSAILATPATKDFFVASVIATIMIPILLYVYQMIYRLVAGKPDEEQAKQEIVSENKKGFEEAFCSKKGEKDETGYDEAEYDDAECSDDEEYSDEEE
ncbi:MAG: hypothetical protein SO170_03555 [Butyribacter sp.]|nr:hypothetical protein [bacterium]MDY3854029.1 hypothetical protein [Butyribacter sp.]